MHTVGLKAALRFAVRVNEPQRVTRIMLGLADKTQLSQQRMHARLGLTPIPGRAKVEGLTGEFAVLRQHAPAQAVTGFEHLHIQAARRQLARQRQPAQAGTNDSDIQNPTDGQRYRLSHG